jgi:hypothetical protein
VEYVKTTEKHQRKVVLAHQRFGWEATLFSAGLQSINPGDHKHNTHQHCAWCLGGLYIFPVT